MNRCEPREPCQRFFHSSQSFLLTLPLQGQDLQSLTESLLRTFPSSIHQDGPVITMTCNHDVPFWVIVKAWNGRWSNETRRNHTVLDVQSPLPAGFSSSIHSHEKEPKIDSIIHVLGWHDCYDTSAVGWKKATEMSYLATNLFLPLSAFAAVAAFETTHLVDVLDIVGNMLT